MALAAPSDCDGNDDSADLSVFNDESDGYQESVVHTQILGSD